MTPVTIHTPCVIERRVGATLVSTIVHEDTFQMNNGYRLHFVSFDDWRLGHRSPDLLFCSGRIARDVGPPPQIRTV